MWPDIQGAGVEAIIDAFRLGGKYAYNKYKENQLNEG